MRICSSAICLDVNSVIMGRLAVWPLLREVSVLTGVTAEFAADSAAVQSSSTQPSVRTRRVRS